MEITIPKRVTKASHGAIVKSLLELNEGFTEPSRTQWPKHVPDLVQSVKRIVVEVEMTNLVNAWGQCLSYHRLGAKEIHLVLPPKLFRQFERDEKIFAKKNPLPNIHIYELPIIKKTRGRPPIKREKMIKVTKRDPAEKFSEGEKLPLYKVPWPKEVEESEEDTPIIKIKPRVRLPRPPSMLTRKEDAGMLDSNETIVMCPSCDTVIPNTRFCLNCAHQLHTFGWIPS